MDCQAINREDLAEKYLRHRLDTAQMDEFETHLLECPKCARELELLQTVQTDLAERAHEIRGWTTAPKPHFFRWQIVVLAGIVIVVATASIVVRWQKTQTTSVTAPPTPPANPPTTAQLPGTNTAGEQAKLESSPHATANVKKVEVAKANTPKLDSNLPRNRRDQLDFTLTNSQTSRDNAPSIGTAPTSGVNVAAVPPESKESSVDGKDKPDSSLNGVKVATKVGQDNSEPVSTSSDSPAKPELTTVQAVELYHLANVVAPPFTFSGFSMKSLRLVPGSTNSHARGGRKTEGDRPDFREAMNAYVSGDYRRAGELLEGAVKVEPNAADVQFYLGICRLLNGHPAATVEPLQRTLAAGTPALSQQAHYYLAKAYLQNMKLQEAEDEFRRASEMNGPLKTDSEALLLRLQALRAQVGSN